MPARHISIEEEYEILGSINEHIALCQEMLLQLEIAPLRIRELKTGLRTLKVLAQEHHMAAEVMMSHELADSFPDGSAPPNTLTPRQVMYLAALNYQHPSRELIGLPPSRTCTEQTADGFKCQAFSMLFTKRAVCGSHGTPAEKRRNAKLKIKWNEDHPDYQI